MRETFEVDRVSYVIQFTENNEFLFFVDVPNSEKPVYRMSPFERSFGDGPPETVWSVTGSGHVFEIKRHVEDVIDKVIKRFNPFYFTYSANEGGENPALPAIRQAAV